LKAQNASVPVGVRRVAATVTALAVVTAVATAGDSLAQSPSVSTPSVSVGAGEVRIDQHALSIAPPTLALAPPVAPLPAPPAPALPQAPKLPSTPVLQQPDEPSLPRVDVGIVRDSAGAVDGVGDDPAGESLRPLGPLDQKTLSRSGAAVLPPTGGASGGASTLGQAGLVAASLPGRSELAKLPPAQRRELIRRAFDTQLRERRLQQLRMTIQRYRGCLRALSYRGRRVLELRAGLRGGAPASRRAIGRRIGASPRTVVRLERSSLRHLIDAGERGLCVGGSAATAFDDLADGSEGPGATLSGRGGGGDPSPAGEVLADAHSSDPSPLIDLGDGDEGPAETLLFFLAALLAVLGPLAAIAIASRRRAGDAATPYRDAGEQPLLFLDVDGVIVLDPFSDGVPPGRIRASPAGLSYVPDRAGALVRELATRFDIVWATGWGHHANTGLSDPLELAEQLPVLPFGKKARFGSSKWKIKPVKDYAGNRPVAWLDDNFVARHERWAAHRPVPTLLVRVDSRVGLTPDHVERLIRWADGLPLSQAAKGGEGGIRTLEGPYDP
jgi:hypothetical protein